MNEEHTNGQNILIEESTPPAKEQREKWLYTAVLTVGGEILKIKSQHLFSTSLP